MRRIYADWAATTPLCEAAREKIVSMLDTFGNPSSVHEYGTEARDALDKAREQVAAAIHAEPEEIVFTSGGTESNNLAILQMVRVLTSPIEHPSVLRSPWVHSDLIRVNREGTIQPFTAACASIMLVNNEVGTVEPVKELAAGDDEHEGVTHVLHVDGVQAVGHIPVDVKDLGCDMLSISGHKFGGPKGTGALYISKRANTKMAQPILWGGGQESGMRPGTENVPGIAAMGEAIAWAVEHLEEHAEHDRKLRDKLIDGIAAVRGVELTGRPTNRAPGIASFVVKDVEGTALVGALAEDGIAASAGSACHAGKLEPSHVLLAMGYEPELAMGALRISIGWDTTDSDVEEIIRCVRQRIRELRGH